MKPHILIVEDHASVREVIADMLREFGVSDAIEEVVSISDARRVLMRQDCDVMITDMCLPDGNIFELIEPMKATGACTLPPIVLISGYVNKTVLEHASRLGIKRKHILRKPIHPLILIETIQALLKSAKDNKENLLD